VGTQDKHADSIQPAVGRHASMKTQARFKVGDQVVITTKRSLGSLGWLSGSRPSFGSASNFQDAANEEPEENPSGVVVDVDVAGQTVAVCIKGRTCKVSNADVQKDARVAANSNAMKFAHVANKGTSIGELSLIYNVHMRENVEAVEDSVVYEISRRCFKAIVCHLGSHKEHEIEQFANLLDEVSILQLLLRGERMELARNATGRHKFAAGEVLLKEGEPRTLPQWYIVERGDCQVFRMVGARKDILGKVQRGGHFGERSVLRGEAFSDCSVVAGPCGVTCLTIDANILIEHRELFLDPDGAEGLDVNSTVSEYIRKIGNSASRNGRRTSIQVRSQEVHMHRLDTIKFLGRGGFGAVSLVRDRVRGDLYALKKMSKGMIVQSGMERRIVSEREIMARIDSPFLMRFYRSFKDDQFVYFLLEVAMGGDLLHVRRDKRQLFEKDNPRGKTIAFYVGCVTLGLQHLHEHNIVYRDLKPENILLTTQGYAKLCDFGFARFCFRKSFTFLGTPDYMAPEMIDMPHKHDHMVDWWALGVMTYELWTGSTPFCSDVEYDNAEEQVLCIRRAQNMGISEKALPRDCPREARDFMKQLVKISPTSRLGAKGGANAVMEHSWFNKLDLNFEALKLSLVEPPFEREDMPDVKELPALDVRPDAGPSPEEKGQEDLFVHYQGHGSGWDRPF